jgi:hypothetical protein
MKSLLAPAPRTVLLPLITALLLLGCQAESPVGTSADEASVRLAPNWSFHHYAPPDPSRTKEEDRAHSEGMFHLMRTFRLAAQASDDWRVVDAAVRAAAAEPSGARPDIREIAAASFMLDVYLLHGEAGPARQEAIAYHTDRLIERRSTQVGLIARAVDRLEGYWPEDRRNRALVEGAEAARIYFATRAECGDCSLDQAVARLGPAVQARHRMFLEETAAVLARL